MVSRNKILLFWAVWGLLSTIFTYSWAVTVPQRPESYIVDLAEIVDHNTEMKLNGYLQELEQKTTAQLVVLTVKSLDGEALEEFTIRIAHDQWKLGQRGKDNGVLVVIALKERKYRIEVGYGLEGILPDSLVGSIGRNSLVPFFKKGEYGKGIYAATLVLANEIAQDAGVKITGMPVLKKTVTKSRPPSFFRQLITFLVFIFLLMIFLRNPRAFLLFFLFSSLGGSGRTWGGRSGSGFGGGGFGSFGGGGGGGFGGGGASGGW